MKIVLSEDRFSSFILNEMLNEYDIADGNAFHNPYAKRFARCKDLIKNFVETNGKIMTCMENGKDYFVYEIYSLSQSLGIRYAICRIIDEETQRARGAILIKPLETFKAKNY